ncbi:hypothetical protein DPMN_032356 [Dreissena polymorpha]|uniref:DUF3990 domain-containing protein n=1 Tax=Dreissena polymorpha TaxID=45954 RepID=A0A9D4M1P4_DREPO|nr:hypothetical protein DPMN_032356 [Dreissena polymorpha]
MITLLKTGRIKQFTDTQNDAVFGSGIYLTTIGPYASKEEVARNNYDGQQDLWENKLIKTEVVLEIETTAKKYNGDRGVYKCDGDILLQHIKKVYIRDEKANIQTSTLHVVALWVI